MVVRVERELGRRFGYFLFFFCSGRGKGESEAAGWGRFFTEDPRGGGGCSLGGAGGPGGCLRRIGDLGGGVFAWGGAKYFFSGSKCPPREELLDYQGRAGIISIIRWNLRPVIFGFDRRNRLAQSRSCGEVSTHASKQLLKLEGSREIDEHQQSGIHHEMR